MAEVTTPAAAATSGATSSTLEPVALYHRDLGVGVCFDDPPNDDFSTPVPPVDCTQPHRFSELIWLMRADGSDQTLFTTTGPSVNGTAVGPVA